MYVWMLRVMRVLGGEAAAPFTVAMRYDTLPASIRVHALIGDAVSRMMCLMGCGGSEEGGLFDQSID